VNSRREWVVSLAVVLALGAVLAWGCSAAEMEQAAGMAELPRQSGDIELPVDRPFQIPSTRKAPSTIASTQAFQLQMIPRRFK
jgi:hypothetical protein